MSGKKNHLIRSLCIPVFAAWALTLVTANQNCRADDDKTYTIKLFHPSKVGDKYEFACTGARNIHNDITLAGQKPIEQAQDLAVEVRGTVEILAVDDKGSETKLSLTVKEFMRTDQKPAVEVLAPGSVVIAEPAPANEGGDKQKTHFSLKGGELSPEQADALDIVLKVSTPGKPTDDEAFGTDNPQKVGATWPLNKAKVIEGATASGIPLNPDDLAGKATLVGTSTVDGKEYAHVTVEFEAKNIKVPLPGGMKVEECKMEAKYSGLFPIDGTKDRGSKSTDMHMEMRAKGNSPDGAAIDVHTTMKMHSEQSRSPIAAN